MFVFKIKIIMNNNLITKCSTFNFENLFQKKGYVYFTKGDYNLNIIGIRNKNKVNKNNVSDVFDDVLVCDYKLNGVFKRLVISITTTAGLYYFKHPMNAKGTGILKEGQYAGAFKKGLHKGYPALIQKGLLSVYRDNDTDGELDMIEKSVEVGHFNIDLHKAGIASQIVQNWSAGCQVCQYIKDFNSIMNLVNQALKLYSSNSFTYTLVNENDLN